MRNSKRNSGIYAYLEASGVLETGTIEDIAAMRKQYYREYKKNWRKEKRIREREFTVSYSDTELKVVEAAATGKHKTVPRFIKEAALAYCRKHWLIDATTLFEIRELLLKTYTAIDALTDAKDRQVPVATLLEKIEALETGIHSKLHQSKSLEDWLTETVRSNPKSKEVLLQLIKSM
jgi:hypothetical protein